MKTAHESIITIVLAGLMVLLLSFPNAQAQGETSYIIVHALNPEGVEIASIEGMDPHCVEIYDGDALIGYGAYNEETFNKPIEISPGPHTIKAKFNGMTKEQTIILNPDETKVLVFTFEREEFDLLGYLAEFNCHLVAQISGVFDGISEDSDAKICSRFSGWSADVLHTGCESDVYGEYSLYAELLFDLSGNSLTWKLVSNAYKTNCWRKPPFPIFCAWHARSFMQPVNEVLNLDLENYDQWFLQYIDCTIQEDFIIEIADQTITGPEYNLYSLPHGEFSIYIKNKHLPNNGLYQVICSTTHEDWCWYHEGYQSIGETRQIKVWLSSTPYDLLGTGIKYEENQPPVASFTYSPETALTELERHYHSPWFSRDIQELASAKTALNSALVGQEITFDASNSSDPDGEIVSYRWDFGDGNVGEGKVVTHAYTQVGEYNVRLTVTDNDGMTDTKERKIQIYELKRGDLLFGLGTSVIPGYWSHVGMYIGDREVVESHSRYTNDGRGGVGITTLSSWFTRYPTWAAVRVLTTDQVREEAINWAKPFDGSLYEFQFWQKNPQIEPWDSSNYNAWRLWGALCGDPNWEWYYRIYREAWYCSEFVWAAYLNATNGGIDLEYGPDITGITPDEIFLDDNTRTIAAAYNGGPQPGIVILAKSPVDIEVYDPDNLVVSKSLIEIEGAIYGEDDINGDGSLEDWIGIPEPKTGEYLIKVIPEPGASPRATYTLEVLLGDGTTIILAENVQISSIPPRPYIIESTETLIKLKGDIDGDYDVDQNDLNILLTYRNQPASECPECDIDGDGVITVLDARKLVLMCTRPRCATE